MLYWLNNACYTEEDVVNAIKKSKGKLSKENFKKIETLADVRKCFVDFQHPYCLENYYSVIQYVVRSVQATNIKNLDKQYLVTPEHHDIFLDLEDDFI